MTEFSTFYSAVKPKDRTDQYVILAAMFALNAFEKPVTAKQIGDLLRLHLGSNSPANVNASLRSYKTYVAPAEKGPPLRWALTDKGLQHLRSSSGLSLATARDENAFVFDVGIICALEHPELAAVMDAFGGSATWAEVDYVRHAHVYRETRLTTAAKQELRVVATTATSMGLTAAAIAATHLILHFRPRLLAMIGIAAGTRSGGKEFGDVLVADPSVDYNSGKVVHLEGIREFQPDPYPIGLHPRVRAVLKKYGGQATVFDEIRKGWSGTVPKTANRLHVGPVGAADQVIDDAERILEIQRHWRKLIGVEMETYGVYRAAYEAPEPKPRVVSFKAVCDFAAEKTDSWQSYAAFMAAHFAAEFLRREWSTLWPTTNISKE